MIVAPSPIARRIRSVSLVLGAWCAFFALQLVLTIALGRQGANGLGKVVEIDLVIAVAWATISFGVAAWHQRVRTIATSMIGVIALHLPTLFLAAVIDAVSYRNAAAMIEATPPRVSFVAYLVYYADFIIVSYLAVVAVVEALLVRRALAARQRLAKRLETSLSRARLDYLEAQLQPHFLFNSLGAVSELAYDAPATANRVLRQLISIFRTALARKSDEVTLGEEIVGIEPYLDIQRIRFADWLTIEYDVEDAAVDCLLPRFILQPLVENAIRHGLSGRSAAGRIDISAAVDGETLIVRVADNGVGLDAAASSAGRGIGLTNVRDRLAIMYGDDERLRLERSAAGGTIAELRIPVRRRSSVPIEEDGASAAPSLSAADEDIRVIRVPALLRNPVVAIAVTWSLCGLVWTQQSFVSQILRGRGGLPWTTLARNDFTSAFVWAVFTALILLLTRRFPIQRDGVVLRACLYFVAAAGVAVAHVAVVQRLTARVTSVFDPVWQMTLIVDFLIFCVLVAIGHRRVLLEWLHARESADAMLTAELAAAQSRATKLQAIPPVLLHSLDGIADTARRDPAKTERQLTRLADYLRLALECTDERGMTIDRERALESAVAALRESGAYPPDLTLSA